MIAGLLLLHLKASARLEQVRHRLAQILARGSGVVAFKLGGHLAQHLDVAVDGPLVLEQVGEVPFDFELAHGNRLGGANLAREDVHGALLVKLTGFGNILWGPSPLLELDAKHSCDKV